MGEKEKGKKNEEKTPLTLPAFLPAALPTNQSAFWFSEAMNAPHTLAGLGIRTPA